jgi:GTPase SAR1 family protein
MCKPNIVVILLGNKTDLENEREVQPEEGAAFAQENDYQFLETSCLKNQNVASAFETLIENTNIEAQKNKSEGNRNESIHLQAKDLKKKSKCCIVNLFL